MSAAAIQAKPVACPCGNQRPHIIKNSAIETLVSVRCDKCGRQGLLGSNEFFALKNWAALVEDEAS